MTKKINLKNDIKLDADSVVWDRNKLNDLLWNNLLKMRKEIVNIPAGQNYDFTVDPGSTKILNLRCSKANWFVDRIYLLTGENGWVNSFEMIKEQIYNPNQDASVNIFSYNDNGIFHIKVENTGSNDFAFFLNAIVFSNSLY